MRSKQKVFVILSPGFAGSESDTTCLPMQQAFVRTMAEAYPEVAVLVLSFHYPFIERTYNWFGVSVTSFNGNNKGGIRGLLLRRLVVRTLERIHGEKEIVGLLSFWLGECASVAQDFAERKGLRHCCWLMGQDAKPGNKYAARLSRRADDLIALSDFLQKEFERNYGVKPGRVIYPGVEKRAGANVNRYIDLLAVGSLIPLKHFDIFLEVVALVKKRMPAVRAVLVGDGPEHQKLEELARALGLANNVDFVVSISHGEVLKTMQRARILIHPSCYEGFSGVCQEALSCGSHVISFCRAMNTDINQWHLVDTKEEMMETALAILCDPATCYEPVEFQAMTCTAQQIMSCYL
jgi:glycosyltransferase involved in cell wall biosynthesis